MRQHETLPVRMAVLTLIEQNGKFLLIQESKPSCRDKWFLPGGMVAPGESILDAAVREAREETGLAVELTGLLYLDQLTGSPESGSAGRIRFGFVGEAAGGTLKQTEDAHSIRAGWFSEEEIGRLDLRSPFVRKVIEIYRGDPAILPISKVHALAPEDRLLERP
jgi:ADP-ribose pyrophosphatase YjhB (NUDIX family)